MSPTKKQLQQRFNPSIAQQNAVTALKQVSVMVQVAAHCLSNSHPADSTELNTVANYVEALITKLTE